jgi:hypothetical protein
MWSRLVGAAVAVLACAGALYAAEPVKERNACSLINPADIASVTGGQVKPGERDDSGAVEQGGYSATCLWKIEGLPNLPAKEGEPFGGKPFVMLNTIDWPAGSGMAKKYVNDFRDAAKQDLIPSTPVEVKTIGDDSLFWGDGVAVAKGDVSFGISVHVGTDKKAEQSMEEALARKIAPKL